MTNVRTYILLLFLLICPCKNLLLTAEAQSWQWARAESNANNIESWAIAADAAGNSYSAASPQSAGVPVKFGSVAIPPIPGGFQSVWVKYDPKGNVLWADGTTAGNSSIMDITTDAAGNLLILGAFSFNIKIGSFTVVNSSTTGWAQYFVAKISPSGTVLWAVDGGDITGGGLYILTYTFLVETGKIATDAAGNVYVTSTFDEATTTIGSYTLTNTDPVGSTTDIFLAKYSSSGSLLWATSMGGNQKDYSLGLTVSTTGNVYVAGEFFSPSMAIGTTLLTNPYTRSLAFIAEYAPTGTPLWAQSAGGPLGATATGLAHDNTGNIYMTGSFDDATISFGSTTVSRAYPGSASQPAMYLVQYSPANVVTWNKSISSPSSAVFSYGIAIAPCGQVWAGGSYTDKAVIGPGDTLAMVPNPIDPVFIAGYDLSGGVIGYAGIASGSDDQMEIACDGTGNVFVGGDFNAPFVVVGPDSLKGPAGAEYMFVAKYTNTAMINPDTVVGIDTAICLSAASIAAGVTLTASPGYSAYYWDNDSMTTTRKVTTAGKYYVYCITCGAPVLVDTFLVGVPDTTYKLKDTAACILASPLTLYAPAGTKDLWSTGSTGPSISVSANGVYWLHAITACNVASDTFKVTFTPVAATTSASNTQVCMGSGPTTLNVPTGYTSDLWSTGSTATFIAVTTAGAYWVQAITGCTMLTDTFNVNFIAEPVVNLGNDTVFCPGAVITLRSPQPPGYTYLWSTHNTENNIEVEIAGTYWLSVNHQGCIATDSVIITALAPPDPFTLGPDTTTCSEDVLQLSVQAGASSLVWSTGSKDTSISVTTAGTYWATLSDACGSYGDTINVSVDNCEIWLPSAFTPNGDNKNDISRVMGTLQHFKDFSFGIYNRYGQRVFYTQDIYTGWDGTFNGTPQDIGTYFYMINYSLNGKKKMMKGDLTLIR